MKAALKQGVVVVVAVFALGAAQAKLPAPPQTEEVKAAAAAAAEKAAWSNKVGAYQLCKAQDKVVAHYLSQARAAGKDVKAPGASAPCADPGPFQLAEAKPIEAAGAHSPSATATTPPSTLQPDAAVNPVKKP